MQKFDFPLSSLTSPSPVFVAQRFLPSEVRCFFSPSRIRCDVMWTRWKTTDLRENLIFQFVNIHKAQRVEVSRAATFQTHNFFAFPPPSHMSVLIFSSLSWRFRPPTGERVSWHMSTAKVMKSWLVERQTNAVENMLSNYERKRAFIPIHSSGTLLFHSKHRSFKACMNGIMIGRPSQRWQRHIKALKSIFPAKRAWQRNNMEMYAAVALNKSEKCVNNEKCGI